MSNTPPIETGEEAKVSHTPGPWRIVDKGTIRAGDAWIARIHWFNGDANARLIANAPATLEAAIVMKEALEEARRELYDERHSHMSDEEFTNSVDYIDAALAKAAGIGA